MQPVPAPRSRRAARKAGRERTAVPRRRRRSAPEPAPAAPAPGDAEAAFETGVAALAAGDADGAVEALRRALYLDPGHAAAAFQLARAHDAREDVPAARRAYWQALALLDDAGQEVGGVARRDLEAVCRARLEALEAR